MSFTVDDFQDLLALLSQHPEWQAELRRQVLGDDFLEVPVLLRRMAEREDQLSTHLDALTMRVEQLGTHLDTLTLRVDQLADRLDGLIARVDQLTEHITTLTTRLDQLTDRVDGLSSHVAKLATEVSSNSSRLGRLEGESLELRYARRSSAYLSRIARRLRVIDNNRLADILDDGVEQGLLTQDERNDALLADLVLRGVRLEDQADVYIVMEISSVIDEHDVSRAADRASILEKLGPSAIAVVGGRQIDANALQLARDRGVRANLEGLMAL